MIDCVFINPGNAKGIYQDLAAHYTTIEPPTWALLLAQSCRSVGYSVAIIDANAECLTDEQVSNRIKKLEPRLICFVVYGQNVNAGTVGMTGAVRLSEHLKKDGFQTPIAYLGSYIQALPKKALVDEPSIDIGFTNEGVYALRNLLSKDIDVNNLDGINGIVWRKNEEVVMNPPEKVVPQDKMDIDLPGYAWDLLAFKEKPLDIYRAPMWHASYDENKRTPYAALQTSIGCVMGCAFCMINIVNKDDNEEIGIASNYKGMRYWSTDFIIKEFDKLVELGVSTIKITDELFLFNKKYYKPLCEKLIERGYGDKLNLWVYSRVDTVANPELLDLIKRAGVKFIALGIESSSRQVRLEVTKGKFQDVDIKKVVDQIHDAGIEVMANYIFGLPGDNLESMRETLELSKELCTSGWNAYAATNLPGSQLYSDALKKGIRLPDSYQGYSFHSYDTVCNATDTVSAGEVLKFRDEAYTEYHTYQPFLDRISKVFGPQQAKNIEEMAQIKLKRKLIEELENE